MTFPKAQLSNGKAEKPRTVLSVDTIDPSSNNDQTHAESNDTLRSKLPHLKAVSSYQANEVKACDSIRNALPDMIEAK